ncbi:hypothetical protein HA402_002518 [Bradysia odoriphaga]|nr:hypothetical protein HA402_002518 [Bradysia odoriphaga]
MDGVLGMALSRKSPVPRAFGFHHTHASPPSIPSDRYLFFHSLASITENRVALSVLDNQTAWNQNPDHSPRSFVRVMTGSISSSVVNFRVQAIQIDELLSGSECTRAGIEMGSSISFPVY